MTKSLQRIIDKSKPQAQKEIETHITEMFENYQIKPIQMSLSDIHSEIFQKKINKSYLLEIIKDKMRLKPERGRYKYPTGFTEYDDIFFKKNVGSYYSLTAEMVNINGGNFKDINADNEDLPF